MSGMNLAGESPVGDPVGDGSGLAGPGAGQHADRPGGRGDDGDLLGVEPGEDPLRPRCWAGRYDWITRHD
jgi:hypothetical protein